MPCPQALAVLVSPPPGPISRAGGFHPIHRRQCSCHVSCRLMGNKVRLVRKATPSHRLSSEKMW